MIDKFGLYPVANFGCVWCGCVVKDYEQAQGWVDTCCEECANERAEIASMKNVEQLDMFPGHKVSFDGELYVYGNDCPKGGCE